MGPVDKRLDGDAKANTVAASSRLVVAVGGWWLVGDAKANMVAASSRLVVVFGP